MLERQGHLPGYTGHIPAAVLEEEAGAVRGPRGHIPNYQGFVPGIKSENLIGKTFGKITEDSALGQFSRGSMPSKAEQYQTVCRESFTNQMRVPVMPLKPKEYPPPPEDPLSAIPPEALYAFFGLINYADTSAYRQAAPEPVQPQPLSNSVAGFFDLEHVDEEHVPRLCYDDARSLANKLRNSS